MRFLYPTILVGLCAWTASAQPSPNAHETEWSRYIADQWATENTRTYTEYVLDDGSRVDIYETTEVNGLQWSGAFEVERSKKWKESATSAAFYQSMTGANVGGVILLCSGEESERLSILRCAIACQRCRLQLWLVHPSGAIKEFPLDEPLGNLLIEEKRKLSTGKQGG